MPIIKYQLRVKYAEEVIALIDARMNEVYFSALKAKKVRYENQEFITWEIKIKEQVCAPELAIAQIKNSEYSQKPIVVGTGFKAYAPFQSLENIITESDIQLPSARYMLPLALPYWYQKKYCHAQDISPIYLRNEVAWKKLPGRE